MTKLTKRELMLSALQDAADWQESFADANKGHDEYEYRKAISLAKQYRAELRRMEENPPRPARRAALSQPGDGR